MITLRPPQTTYTNPSDVGKFDLLWNISLLLTPVLGILFVMHIVFSDATWVTSFLGMLVALSILGILYKTRKYEMAAALCMVAGVLLLMTVIFVFNASRLLSDALWSITIAFFAYYFFSSWWGALVLFINISALVIREIWGLSFDQRLIGKVPDEENYKMAVNVIYVTFALGYVIHRIIQNNHRMSALYEKEIERNELLVKEIHHRVKNNLQIISSLLRLQAQEISDSRLAGEFDEAVSRIRSMALIHEKLYQKGDLSGIDLSSYIRDLLTEVADSIQSELNVKLSIKSEISEIDIKHIVPLGLILNELITNSIKHGFKQTIDPEISVSICLEGDRLVLNYSDNGQWVNPSSENSFGLELLNILSEQLDGTLARNTENGTKYKLLFNRKKMIGI